jgi:hypothetical protein
MVIDKDCFLILSCGFVAETDLPVNNKYGLLS